MLVAALGRTPRTEELGLETVGLEGGGYVEVDENMQVPGHDWLYAIGDVNGRILLTHMGKYQARLACEHILGNPSAAEHGADGKQSPRVVFTDPQVASVGHTEKTAREAGLDVHILEVGTSANAGGSFYGRNAPGTSRLLVDKETDLIVGATITGAEVADFLQAATIAIVGEVPMGGSGTPSPSFPTRSEIWLNLLAKWESEGEGHDASSPTSRGRRSAGRRRASRSLPVSGRRGVEHRGRRLRRLRAREVLATPTDPRAGRRRRRDAPGFGSSGSPSSSP